MYQFFEIFNKRLQHCANTILRYELFFAKSNKLYSFKFGAESWVEITKCEIEYALLMKEAFVNVAIVYEHHKPCLCLLRFDASGLQISKSS